MDRVINEVGAVVTFEPNGFLPLKCRRHVRLLIQRVSVGREGVRGLVDVVSVAIVLYEGMLIWVPVPGTGGATPGSSHSRRTCRRKASRAAFAAFLLNTAHANCSSLHCMLTFFGV